MTIPKDFPTTANGVIELVARKAIESHFSAVPFAGGRARPHTEPITALVVRMSKRFALLSQNESPLLYVGGTDVRYDTRYHQRMDISVMCRYYHASRQQEVGSRGYAMHLPDEWWAEVAK